MKDLDSTFKLMERLLTFAIVMISIGLILQIVALVMK